MKHIIGYKLFESTDTWSDITSSYDVGQLLDLIHFKYGKDSLPESTKEFDEDEGDYNPDDIYDTIRFELEECGKLDDLLQNYQAYGIEKDEADPFHWRYRQKEMEKFNKSFRDISESVSDTTIHDILLDLTDEGFRFNINWNPSRNGVDVSITKRPGSPGKYNRVVEPLFTYPDIKDSIDRLSGYMETEGFTTSQKFVNNQSTNKITIRYKFSSLSLLKAKSKYAI